MAPSQSLFFFGVEVGWDPPAPLVRSLLSLLGCPATTAIATRMQSLLMHHIELNRGHDGISCQIRQLNVQLPNLATDAVMTSV